MSNRPLLSQCASLFAAILFATSAGAQQVDEQVDEQPADDGQAIDEIVVIGNKDGDPIDLEAHYEAQLRERITAEYMRLQALEEEEQWRETLPEAVEGPGRIKWGYDAQAESRMRRDTALTDLPMDNVKPATVISISF